MKGFGGRSVCFVLESLSLPSERRLERPSGWLGEGVSLADERLLVFGFFLLPGEGRGGWRLSVRGFRFWCPQRGEGGGCRLSRKWGRRWGSRFCGVSGENQCRAVAFFFVKAWGHRLC